jgi:hypothetical protein
LHFLMPCHIFLRENKASIILATACNLCSEATIFSLQAEIFIKSRTVQLCQGHDFQTAPATRLHGHVYQVAFVEGDLSAPEAQKACVYCLMGCALAMRACLALDPQSRPSAQEFIRQMNSWAPSGLRLLVLDGRHEFHGKRGRFSILLGEVSPAVLDHLQQDAEAIRQGALYASEPHADLLQERDDQGLLKAELFGKLGPAAPATLDGRKLLQDLPPRLSQFVAAFKKLNEKLFNNFDTLLRRAIASRLQTGNGDKNSEHLTKEASSLWWGSAGSIQGMRPTSRAESRHIDGRAGILHAGVSVFGERLGWHCFHASFRSCGAETFFWGPGARV